MPEFVSAGERPPADHSQYDIEIIAEINHAPRLSDAEIVRQADAYRHSGADVIDLGCIPGERWLWAGDTARLLVREGHRVSIDSFERCEVEAAVSGGAELVLSVNSTNIAWAAALDAELVAIPDDPRALDGLQATIDALRDRNARFRIDPILEPIGFGFAASLARYYEARRRWPELEMMMGIGNVTELTEVDTAGMNVLLAAICQELGVKSVLTTEVINWASSAVREFDVARRLVRHSLEQNVLPKHVDSRLVMLRDPKVVERGPDELAALAAELTDPNFRIFVEAGEIHLMNRDGHWRGRDAYELFDRAIADSPGLDASHAFYLGYELSKAVTALTLGKQYVQDEALRWGMLTVPEVSAHDRRKAEAHAAAPARGRKR
ncbi:MAG: dihydropteroate synthase [Planctomycetes bacterium]|nr:dihydropteroate synthase [Planctomycetota bacterium]